MILLIKHESAPTAFVINLAEDLKKNLKSRGRKLTTIIESTLPDEKLRLFKEHANKTSRILLVTTVADLESGWFRKNVDTGPDARKPVIAFFGDIDPGILANFGNINFGPSEEANRHAFQLLCRQLGGEDLEVAASTKLQPTRCLTETSPPLGAAASSFHQELFERLQVNPTQLLLAQSGRGERAFVQQIRDDAVEHYGESGVLAFTPPSSLDLNLAELFTYLGKECGFEGISKQFHWEREFKKKVAAEGRVFLLISRFEHALQSSQKAIAKVLRGLSEELELGSLHIVVCGGMSLVEQKFVEAEHSLLNHAVPMLFPDLEVGDLIEWANRDIPGILPTEFDGQELLERYGGHPGLLKQALGVLRRVGSPVQSAMMEAILQEESADRWFEQYFVPYRHVADDTRKVCEYLAKPDKLGRFSFWPDEEILRRLFWGNLLTTNQEKLRWRSEIIVKAGLEILGCEQAA